MRRPDLSQLPRTRMNRYSSVLLVVGSERQTLGLRRFMLHPHMMLLKVRWCSQASGVATFMHHCMHGAHHKDPSSLCPTHSRLLLDMCRPCPLRAIKCMPTCTLTALLSLAHCLQVTSLEQRCQKLESEVQKLAQTWSEAAPAEEIKVRSLARI